MGCYCHWLLLVPLCSTAMAADIHVSPTGSDDHPGTREAPVQNRDSVAPSLEGQGFRKAILAEVRLFDPSNTHNFCTLYQKACKEGENISIGKWAVPLFFP